MKDNYFIRTVRFLFGSLDEYGLEYRLFNAIAFSSFLAGILATIGNLFMDLNPSLYIATSAATIVLFFIYYIARFKKQKRFVFPIFVVVIFFSVFWSITYYFSKCIHHENL